MDQKIIVLDNRLLGPDPKSKYNDSANTLLSIAQENNEVIL